MILAHELAHIRRHDYLVNALQTVVETLLFFHPAVHWISARARQEREECCDAVAVRFGGDAVAYARALTELEELRGMRIALALGATGGVLLDRIERLLGQRPSRQSGTALASACALATLTALTATVSAPLLANDPLVEPVAIAAVVAPSPTANLTPPAATGTVVQVPVDEVPAPVRATPALRVESSDEVAPAAVVSHESATAAASGDIAMLPTEATIDLGVDLRVEPPATPATGVGPLITGGEQLVGVAPAYPYGARSRGIGGTVTARLLVDASGRTQGVQILAADPPAIFDRAVVRALSNWRYAPLREDGVALQREIIQQLEFVPESAECHTVTGTRLCRKVGGDGDRRADGVTVIRLR
jgi:TonB family protein